MFWESSIREPLQMLYRVYKKDILRSQKFRHSAHVTSRREHFTMKWKGLEKKKTTSCTQVVSSSTRIYKARFESNSNQWSSSHFLFFVYVYFLSFGKIWTKVTGKNQKYIKFIQSFWIRFLCRSLSRPVTLFPCQIISRF